MEPRRQRPSCQARYASRGETHYAWQGFLLLTEGGSYATRKSGRFDDHGTHLVLTCPGGNGRPGNRHTARSIDGGSTPVGDGLTCIYKDAATSQTQEVVISYYSGSSASVSFNQTRTNVAPVDQQLISGLGDKALFDLWNACTYWQWQRCQLCSDTKSAAATNTK